MLGLHCCVIFPCLIWSVPFLFRFKLFTISYSNTEPLKNRARKVESRIEHQCAKGLFESRTYWRMNTINITMATMKLVTKAIVSFYPCVVGQVKGDNFGERLKP